MARPLAFDEGEEHTHDMSPSDPSVVDPVKFTVSRTITTSANQERVWAALTEVDHLAHWFGETAVLDELAVGAGGVFIFEGYGRFPVRIEEIDAPRMIAYRWSNQNARPVDPVDMVHSTVFRFTLSPVAEGTQLTVVENGFENLIDPIASLEANRVGWDWELDELVDYLEKGV